MRVLVVFLIALVLSGCDTEGANPRTDGVTFSADQQVYAVGVPVSATLTNGSEVTVGYNFCLVRLERRAEGAWKEVPRNVPCQAILRSIRPGEEKQMRLEPGEHFEIPRGTYRLTLEVEVGGQDRTLQTETFAVGLAER